MPFDISVALLINLAFLLVLSWAFFLVVLIRNSKKNKNSAQNNDSETANNLQTKIDILENQLQEKLQTIEQLHLQLAQQQEIPILSNEEDLPSEDWEAQLNEAQIENLNLQEQLELMSQKVADLSHAATKHDEQSHQLEDYIKQNKKNRQLIDILQDKLMEVQQTANETQAALDNKANTDGDSLERVLQRTENERKCIEEQYMDLSAQLDAAEQISEQLGRSQKECVQLEQAYLDVVAEAENVGPAQIQKSRGASITPAAEPEPKPTLATEPAIAEDKEPETTNEFAIDTRMDDFMLDGNEFDFDEDEFILDNSEQDPDFSNDDFGSSTGIFAKPDNTNPGASQ